MYVYYRQCYRALKPAAIFPIEVELGFDPMQSTHYGESHDIDSKSHDNDPGSHDAESESHDQKKEEELNDDQMDLLLPSVPLPPPTSSAPPTDPQESEIDRILAHDFEHEQ